MPIILYRNKDCARCEKIARVHKKFDWLRRVNVSTETSPVGPLQPGEIAVQDAQTGETLQGVDAVRRICREIPAYRPLLLLLKIPFIARRVDQDVRGCSDGSCAIPPS